MFEQLMTAEVVGAMGVAPAVSDDEPASVESVGVGCNDESSGCTEAAPQDPMPPKFAPWATAAVGSIGMPMFGCQTTSAQPKTVGILGECKCSNNSNFQVHSHYGKQACKAQRT